MVVTYCTATDVGDLFNFTPTETSKPSKAVIEKFINWNEDDIDRRTGHGWRLKTVKEEYHHIGMNYNYAFGFPLKLIHRQIAQPSVALGDKLEFWDGQNWENWFSTRTEGNDYILDLKQGIIFLRALIYSPFRRYRFRTTYRYGETGGVPLDITKACVYLTAADFIDNADFWEFLPQGTDRKSIEAKVAGWLERASEIISRHAEMVHVGN